MEYYVKSVVPIIESNYDKFTPVEKQIANFFIHNSEKMDFSIKHISELLFTSKATLVRFAQKCGYHGYKEFIYQYEETLIEKPEKITDNTRMVLNAYQELLNKAYSLVDEIQIGRIMGYLNKADRVLVCGLRIGVNVDSLLDPDMMRMSSVFQNKNSLVIGFSLSGEREEVLYLLRESNRKGAKTILFTENNKSEFDEYCSEVVLLPSLKHLNHGNVISPQFPILVMLDIIYGYYVEQNKYIREGMHDSTLRALEEGEKRRKELY